MPVTCDLQEAANNLAEVERALLWLYDSLRPPCIEIRMPLRRVRFVPKLRRPDLPR